MIELGLSPADVVRVRFARSPMQELATSLTVLRDPGRAKMHLPWTTASRPRIAGLGIAMLRSLLDNPRYVPNLLIPPPEHTGTTFGDELARVRATPAETVRADLDRMRGPAPLAADLRQLYDDPERRLGSLADELLAYWRAAIEPVWPRLRGLLDADLGYRADQLTSGGVVQVLATLHPDLEYTDNALRIHWSRWDSRSPARGTGLLLVPCVFAWPKLLITKDGHQPMLTYAPRGVGQVWAGRPARRQVALAELLGRSRAALLAHLDLPVSTTQLAGYLGLTAASVSEHLSVLRRSGLVTSRRSGRSVLYQRTPLATELLAAG